MQPDLFDTVSKVEEKKRDKNEKISRVMDRLNQKFGKDARPAQAGASPVPIQGYGR